MVFNATFNNTSVLLMEETGGPGENHRPVESHWQTLKQNGLPLTLIEIRLTTLVVTGTDGIGSCKSNYHAIKATMVSM